VRKYTIVIINQLNINKIKSTKKILENITKNERKKESCREKL
jgi:hypothetical protein